MYGTLIDTHGVVAALRQMVGEAAEPFSHMWRDKQLEYSFRRGLMQNYESFAVCTSQALDYTDTYHEAGLTQEQKRDLLGVYRELPAFPDVTAGLDQLKAANFRMYAFSNGSAEAVEELLANAGIRDSFLGVVSVDALRSFKPNPAVYSYFLRSAGASGANAWLISGNCFDVIGAMSAGMRGAWVRRSPKAIFDPWGMTPTITVSSVSELAGKLAEPFAIAGKASL